MNIDDKLYARLVQLGIVSEKGDDIRDYNVGESNYAIRIIQPWSVWMDWNLNPWDADIVKRICRTKIGEDDEKKYNKIIHICKERLRQINCENKFKSETIDLGE